MNPTLEIEFRMGGVGWADLLIRKGKQANEIEGISYLSDALDDLVRLGIAIATGRAYGWAQFFHEPGSTVLLAECGWPNADDENQGCRLGAIAWGDLGDGEPTWSLLHKSEREFSVVLGSRDELPAAILAAAERVEKELGVDGYSKQWSGRLGFPSRAVAALKAALATPAMSKEDWNG